jgi:plasmid stabilization system protein ParE
MMARGDESKYSEKQRRQAERIEEGYQERGVNEDEAERRAWASVNKMTGGGKKSGSGRGEPVNKAPAREGGRLGGAAAAARPRSARSAPAKKRHKPAHPANMLESLVGEAGRNSDNGPSDWGFPPIGVSSRSEADGLYSRTSPAHQSRQQHHDEDDQEDEEQNLRDACRSECDSTKAQKAGDDRDDQKQKCPIEHTVLHQPARLVAISGNRSTCSQVPGILGAFFSIVNFGLRCGREICRAIPSRPQRSRPMLPMIRRIASDAPFCYSPNRSSSPSFASVNFLASAARSQCAKLVNRPAKLFANASASTDQLNGTETTMREPS